LEIDMLPDYLIAALRTFARENAVFFAWSSAVFFTTTLILGAGWLRRLSGVRSSSSLTPPSGTDDQLAQLLHAVDAVAIEVERVGEAQRYESRGRIEGITPPVERRPLHTPTPH
jgi:hypothetical protein